MKITKVNTYFVRPRWGFVEIETDAGATGWGEAVLEGHAAAVLACVNEMSDYLVGNDPATTAQAQEMKTLLESGGPADLIGTVSSQYWNGIRRIQFIVEEMQPSAASE